MFSLSKPPKHHQRNPFNHQCTHARGSSPETSFSLPKVARVPEKHSRDSQAPHHTPGGEASKTASTISTTTPAPEALGIGFSSAALSQDNPKPEEQQDCSLPAPGKPPSTPHRTPTVERRSKSATPTKMKMSHERLAELSRPRSTLAAAKPRLSSEPPEQSKRPSTSLSRLPSPPKPVWDSEKRAPSRQAIEDEHHPRTRRRKEQQQQQQRVPAHFAGFSHMKPTPEVVRWSTSLPNPYEDDDDKEGTRGLVEAKRRSPPKTGSPLLSPSPPPRLSSQRSSLFISVPSEPTTITATAMRTPANETPVFRTPSILEDVKLEPIVEGRERADYLQAYDRMCDWCSKRGVRVFPLANTHTTGATVYFVACEREGILPVSKFFMHCDQHEMNLSRMNLGDPDVVALCEGLDNNLHVTSLALHNNGFGPRGCAAVVKMVTDNVVLSKLDLSVNRLDGKTVAGLAAAMRLNRLMTELTLKNCGLHDEDIVPLFDVLADRLCSLKKLVLSQNKITNPAELGSALGINHSLIEVDLSYNQFQGNASAVALALNVAKNWSIHTLDLSWNHLGSATCQALAMWVAEDPCPLISLRMQHCDIDGRAAYVLGMALEKNRQLEELDIRGNNIGEEGVRAIFAAVGLNRTLKALDIRKCNVLGGQTLFNESDPSGHYSLDLADPFDRAVAARLQRIEATEESASWTNISLNGQSQRMSGKTTRWKIPKSGRLVLDFTSAERMSMADNVVSDRVTALIKGQLAARSSDFERHALLRLASNVLMFTCQQAKQLLSVFSDPAPIREHKVASFMLLFDRLMDRANFLSIVTAEFTRMEIAVLYQRCGGNLLSFDPKNPTGHYEFDLSSEFQRRIACKLYSLTMAEPGGTHSFKSAASQSTLGSDGATPSMPPPKSPTEKQLGVCRPVLDGRHFQFDPEAGLPSFGRLVLDYVAGREPDSKCSPLSKEDVARFKSMAQSATLQEEDLHLAVELSTADKAISADHAQELLSLFKVSAIRARIAHKLFGRLVDRGHSVAKLMDGLTTQEQAAFSFHVGNSNLFSEKNPFRHWRLDLSDPYDWSVGMKLARMSSPIEGMNWHNTTLDDQPFGYTDDLPTAGILELDFAFAQDLAGKRLLQKAKSAILKATTSQQNV